MRVRTSAAVRMPAAARRLAVSLGLALTTLQAPRFALAAGEAAPPAIRLTLAETVTRAREASPRMAQLRALEEAAAAATRGARAQGRPAVDLSVGYARWSDVPELALPLPTGGTQVVYPNLPDNYLSHVGINAPIYTGGRVSGASAAADHERAAAARDVEAGTGDTTLEASAAYWGLVAAREEERVLREAIASYEAHLKETRDREQVGMAARNDVLSVQVGRDQAELARLRAANAAEIANADLVRILGLDPGVRVETADPLEKPEIPAGDLDALVAAALAARPERAALQERVAAAEERVRAQKAGYHPQLGLKADYDFNNPNRRVLPWETQWQDTWDIGVNLSITLLDSGRTSAAVEEASARAEVARRQLDDLDRRIRLEVASRWLDLGAASAGVDVATRGLEAADENRRVSADRYREGLIPSSDLLDAENGLLRAGLDRVQALAVARLALASLERAVGK